MSEYKTIPQYEVLPIDPENNPPETIEEIEALVSKLQDKTDSISQQLEVIAIREKQGLEVDYTRVKRALFAKRKTNKSISALQRIAKKKRQQSYISTAFTFEKFFFEVAKEILSAKDLSRLMDITLLKIREADEINLKA